MTQQFYFWVYIQRNPNTNLKEYTHLYVHCTATNNSQATETTQVPISGWLDEKVGDICI